jgi:polyribonucleotide nucleotidyltransferase
VAKTAVAAGRIDPKIKEFLNFLGIDISEMLRLMADVVMFTALDGLFNEEELKEKILENLKQQVEQIDNELEMYKTRIEELKVKIKEYERNIKDCEKTIKELESRKERILSIVNKCQGKGVPEIEEYANYFKYKYELIKEDLNKYFTPTKLYNLSPKAIYSVLEAVAEKNNVSVFCVIRIFKQCFNVDLKFEEGRGDDKLS